MTRNEPSLCRQTILPFLSLFTSVGTLLCCALPALLVTLGMGATLAGFIGAVPWITAVSDYKPYIFSIAALLLALATVMQWRARHAPCPPDPQKARACKILRRISWGILILSVLLYAVGFFFAFLAADLFYGQGWTRSGFLGSLCPFFLFSRLGEGKTPEKSGRKKQCLKRNQSTPGR